jgi:nucleoside 2-deoxyribosyltransferase
MKTIYLAGPEVFFPDALERGEIKKQICERYGFKGRFPFDAEITPFANDHATGMRIYEADERMACGCDAIIANITPFRGVHADVGTAFEMGLSRASGHVVCAYTEQRGLLSQRIPYWSKNERGEALDHEGFTIEDFKMVDNLMLEGGAIASGGIVVARVANETWQQLFESCVRHLAERWGS